MTSPPKKLESKAPESDFDRVSALGILFGIPLLFLIAFVYPLFPHEFTSLRFCAFWHFFHVDCPGCGLIRAFMALTQGDLRASINAHPLGMVIALFLVLLFLRTAVSVWKGKKLPPLFSDRLRLFLVWCFLLSLLGLWAMKLYRSLFL